MKVVLTLLTILVPIGFALLLGVLAGRTKLIDPKQNGVFFTLALDFCLPSLMFITTATMSTAELTNWRFYLGIAGGLLIVYAVAFVLWLTIFKKSLSESSIQALNGSFPNMAAMGVPLLTAVLGASAVVSVVVGNLISGMILLPITLTILEAGSPDKKGEGKGEVVWESVLGAIRKPIVWAPLAGAAFAFMHIAMPDLAKKTFNLMGEATSAVSLFAIGLLLAGQTFKMNWGSALNIGFKLLVQPAVMLLLAVLLGVAGVSRREMILLGAMPTASMIAAFAGQYNVGIDETDATILLSTILSIFTLGAIVAMTG